MSDIVRFTGLQKRDVLLPAQPSLYRQRYVVTPQDKRYYVYGWFCGCLLLLLLLKYWFEPVPQSNAFAWCLLGLITMGGYAYLATFYRQVSTAFFLTATLLILLAPVIFLLLVIWERYL